MPTIGHVFVGLAAGRRWAGSRAAGPVALFWPFASARIASPVVIIPPAPFGASFLSLAGLRVASIEMLEFAALLVYALRPPGRPASLQVRSTEHEGIRRRSWLGVASVVVAGLAIVVAIASVHAWRRALSPIRIEGKSPVAAFAWDPSGDWLAVGDQEGHLEIWSARGEPAGRPATGVGIPRGRGAVRALAFSPSGERLAVVRDGALLIHPVIRDGDRPVIDANAATLCSGEDELTSVTFSPLGTEVLAGSHHRARIWSLASGQVRLSIYHPTYVQGVAFSPDASLLATAGNDGVRLFDAGDGTLKRALHGGGVACCVAFSHDGELVATTCDGGVRIWGVRGADPPRILPAAQQLGFSRDDASLMTSGPAPLIWRAADGALIGALDRALAGPALFSPTDGRVAVATEQGIEIFPWRAVPH